MAKVALVTDSTAYIPPELVKEYDISVAPQILIWNGEELRDDVDIKPDEFYQRLSRTTVMPSTSQVTPAGFHKIFKEKVDAGYEVLAVLISEKLSGTIASALQAREMLPGAPIEIFDSRITAMAMGFQVIEAAKLAKLGASLSDCKAAAEMVSDRVGVIFAVDTLEFLHRGGRIGGAARFLGTALKLKPILEVNGGRVEAIERVRTRAKSLERLIELVEERTQGRRPLHLATLHANARQEACELLETASRRLGAAQSILSEVSPVVGTHAGPGTVGLAYMAGI